MDMRTLCRSAFKVQRFIPHHESTLFSDFMNLAMNFRAA